MSSSPHPRLAHMDLQALAPLVGDWTTTAIHRLFDAPIPGQTSFTWLDRGGYLIQHAAMDEPVFPTSVAVLGPSADGTQLVQHYFDSRGVTRILGVSLLDGEWKLWRDGPDFAQRFSGTFSADGDRIDGAWEIDEGAGWQHDFDLSYVRA